MAHETQYQLTGLLDADEFLTAANTPCHAKAGGLAYCSTDNDWHMEKLEQLARCIDNMHADGKVISAASLTQELEASTVYLKSAILNAAMPAHASAVKRTLHLHTEMSLQVRSLLSELVTKQFVCVK